MNLMSADFDLELIGNLLPMMVFEIDECVQMLNCEIIRKADSHFLPKPPVDKIGHAVGILTMNSEVELLVRFDDKIEQLKKMEFYANYIELDD
jgi:hypothetical protein